MASHSLNGNTAAPSGAPIAAYLDELGARLLGPRRRRAQILAELRDGLDHATDEHLAAGMSARQAQAAAVARFGSPPAVADAFAGELATAYARRTLALYVLTGPLVGIWWLLLRQPDPWRAGLIALLAAIPVLPLVVIAIATAAGTLASTGRLMRWLPEAAPGRALAATAVIAGLCIGGDLTMIGLFVASETPVRPLAIIAVAASIIRIACGTTVICRAGRMRAHSMSKSEGLVNKTTHD
jgi:HAAS